MRTASISLVAFAGALACASSGDDRSPGAATESGSDEGTAPALSAGDDDDETGDGSGDDAAETGTGGEDGAPVPTSCTKDACGGHGVCEELESGVACTCDEGFTGTYCDEIGPDYHARTLLVPDLADPDVLAEHDDAFYLTGTGSTLTVPIYASSDLVEWEEVLQYDPSAVDPAHDYCHVWAPDLTRWEGQVDLYFSAHRVAEGAPCPPPSGQTVTTFHVAAPDFGFAFGVPALVDNGPGLPASQVASGCPPEGCSRAIRIDAAAYDDGVDRWFFYVWFQGGNNIAAYRFGSPESLVLNAGPAVFATAPYEESINEGPDVFLHDGRHHLFFSAGFFDSQYAMYHVVADEVADLTRARAVRRHSMPVRNAAGLLVESHGHNSLVQRRGEVFNVFHQGEFDAAGNLTGRSTYKQRISFSPDGSIVALNFVDLRWSRVPGAEYSLDVVTRDGRVLGPCVAVGRLGDATSTRWNEICPDAADTIVRKADVAAFRVYWSTDGQWTSFAELPYDGAADRVFVPIPGGATSAVALRWNEQQTGAEYSLDVQRGDGTFVAPCVGAPSLGTAIETVFDGACTSTAATIAIPEIQAFRVCSAVGGDWANATCGTTPYDGTAGFIDVAIPR